MNPMIRKISGGTLAISAALLVGACLMPVGDGEGLDIEGNPEPAVYTLADVRPMFQSAGCASCHGGSSPSGGMLLNSFNNARDAFFVIGADTVPRASVTFPNEVRIKPGSPDSSHLYKRITSADPSFKMPPSGPGLNDAQKEIIRQWILSGALLEAPATP